jgi:aspartokinase
MAKNLEIVVQKYGGSSVASPQKIKAVAQFIKSTLHDDRRICVVVSAMGHATNELISLAHQICENPPKRELDMFISCGERSSMALLAMALIDIGVTAISLTGSQSGIITDDKHSGAEIIEVKPIRVIDAFNNYQVVLIAGFQGVSLKKEITTLRRGGSDTTAVAMAAAINASVCEIYSDVAGVMDVDPRITEYAQILPHVNIDQMEAMALYGAKIMAHDAIRIAKEFGVTLRVAQTGEKERGTFITKDLRLNKSAPVFALSHLRAVIQITISSDGETLAMGQSDYFLCGLKRGTEIVAYTSNDISQKLAKEPTLKVVPGLALITIHLRQNQDAFFVVNEVTRLLAQQKINPEDIIVGRNEIFVVVADHRLNDGLCVLHEGLLRCRGSQ